MAFTDLPAQQAGVQLLQRSLARGRLAHAYLFSGDQLEELETVARTLAKSLNCQTAPRSTPTGTPTDCCDKCFSCRKIDDGGHPDIYWLRPESKSRVITIEQVRDLMKSVHLKPTQAEFKVAVIAAAERMNLQAANAFLKTLEEPPAKSVLILLSTDSQRMLETIQSRCLRLNFADELAHRGHSAFAAWLNDFSQTAVAEQTGLLSRYRLLSVLLKRLGELKSGIAEDLTSRSPLEKYDEVEPQLREKWEDELAAGIEAEYRRQRADLLAELHWWLRDIWLTSLNIGTDLLCYPRLADQARTVACRISFEQATENLRIMGQTHQVLNSNVQEALALEVGLLQLKL